MALPLLAAARLLTAGTSRGALMSAGKSIAKDKLLGGGKDKIKKDAKKSISADDEKGRGGALVKVEKKSISVQKLLETPERGGQLGKDINADGGRKNKPRSLESLVKVIETIQKNINNITDILGKKKKFDDKKLLNKKKDASAEKKKNREDELEEDKTEKKEKKSGGIEIKAPSFLDRVINFFSNILLGGLVDFLLTNQQQVFKILDDIQNGLTNNWKFATRLLIGFRKPITALASFAGKSLLNPLYLPTKALQVSIGLTGKAVTTSLSALGSSIKNIVNLSVKSVAGGARFGVRAATAASGALKGGQGVRGATKAVGTAAQRSFRQATAPKPSVPKGKGLNVLGKPGALAAKGFFRRIPILGPILVGVASLMAGEPVNQSLFKAGGAALGGALGSFIPIPILGTMLGEFIGEFVGDIFYELILGKGIGGAKTKLWNGVKRALDVGGIALNWVKRGGKKYIDNFPKYRIPNPGFPGFIKNALEMSVGWKKPMKGLQDFLGGHPWSPFKIIADNQWFGNKKGKLSQLPDPTFQFRDPLGFLKHIKNSFFEMPKNPPKDKLADLEPLENTGGENQSTRPSPQIHGSTASPEAPTPGASIRGGGSDFWTLVAAASREDGDPQGRADVAQSVYNRLASGAYSGKTIRDLILGTWQFEPTWRYPNGPKKGNGNPNSEWFNITDSKSAAAATGMSENAMKSVASQLLNASLQKNAREFVQGRTDFTGYSKSQRSGQILRKSGDNYFGWDWNYKANKVASVPNFGAQVAQQQSDAVAQQAATSNQARTDKNETRIAEPAMLKGRDTQSQESTAQLASQQPASSRSSQMTQSISQSSPTGKSGLVPLPPSVIPIGGGSQSSGQSLPMGGYSMSKQEMLNNYYQSQLIGFLYKQG